MVYVTDAELIFDVLDPSREYDAVFASGPTPPITQQFQEVALRTFRSKGIEMWSHELPIDVQPEA